MPQGAWSVTWAAFPSMIGPSMIGPSMIGPVEDQEYVVTLPLVVMRPIVLLL